MRLILALLLVSATFVPLAQALPTPSCFTTVVFGCVNETDTGDDCDTTPGGTGSASTMAFVLSPAGVLSAGGRSQCAGDFRDSAIDVMFASGANFAFVGWADGGDRGCFITAVVVVGGQFQRQSVECPAGGPPNPGWGRLLP